MNYILLAVLIIGDYIAMNRKNAWLYLQRGINRYRNEVILF